MRIPLERTAIPLTVAALVALVVRPALVVLLHGAGAAGPALALALSAAAGLAVGELARRRLPASLDGAARRHPGRALLVVVLAAVTLVQTGRLGAYLLDPSTDWWITTKQEFWSKHACAAAYFYAADLDRQGEENVYDASHYPGLKRDAAVHPTLENLVPEDPYQYPPPFLLLPRLAMAFSNDFAAIRPVWTAVQALFFLGVAVLLARWTGGRAGATALALVPLLWISVPSALNFQYGQFHATAIALGMAAFLAFESRRDALGGGILAAAVLAKGFPGIVLLPLLLRRRWGAVAWTGAWAAAFTALAWGVLGGDVFRAFLGHHVAQIGSGASFAFEEAWPELRVALLAGNVSPMAALRKVAELGWADVSLDAARTVQGLFTVACVAASAWVARIGTARGRSLAWLALINLASLTSPAAWGDYVPVGTLWLVTLVTAGKDRWPAVATAAVGGFCFLLPGVVPIGHWPGAAVSMALSIAGTVLLVVANSAAILREAPLRLRAGAARGRDLALDTR